MDIDLNEVGRNAYRFLCRNHIIPDKKKTDLTPKEIENLIDVLYDNLESAIEKCRSANSHKYEFLSYIYLNVILYLNNTDLNKYIRFKETEEKIESMTK